MLVYKILRAAEWAAFQASGHFAGSPDDIRDGFIHLSTDEQTGGTLARHFAGLTDLVVVTLDGDAFGSDLRWEPSRGDVPFPHLYRALESADIVEVRPAESVECG